MKRVQEELRKTRSLIFVICESRVKDHNIGSIMNNQGWSGMCWISNHSNHPGGQIIILWKDNSIHIGVTFSSQLIHYIVSVNEFKLELSAVYGFNDEASRQALWDEIRRIHVSIASPWIIIGDFNVVCFVDERSGK